MEAKNYYKEEKIKTNADEAEEFADELLKKLDGLYGIKKITRNKSYNASHTGVVNSNAKTVTEKLIAISMFHKKYAHIGEVLDYEVPLKDTNDDVGVGKIDLIAYGNNQLYLLELKAPESRETLLRCALEVFTYWKTLDHQKLLYDYELPQDTIVKKAVFIFEDKSAHSQYRDGNSKTTELMEKLGVDIFVIHNHKDIGYEVLLP